MRRHLKHRAQLRQREDASANARAVGRQTRQTEGDEQGRDRQDRHKKTSRLHPIPAREQNKRRVACEKKQSENEMRARVFLSKEFAQGAPDASERSEREDCHARFQKNVLSIIVKPGL